MNTGSWATTGRVRAMGRCVPLSTERLAKAEVGRPAAISKDKSKRRYAVQHGLCSASSMDSFPRQAPTRFNRSACWNRAAGCLQPSCS